MSRKGNLYLLEHLCFAWPLVQLTYGPLFAATQNLYLLMVLQSLSRV